MSAPCAPGWGGVRTSTSLSEVTLRIARQLSPKAGLSVSPGRGWDDDTLAVWLLSQQQSFAGCLRWPLARLCLADQPPPPTRDGDISLLSQCPSGTDPATRSSSYKNLSWGWGSPATSLSSTWNYLQGEATGLGIVLLVSCNSWSTQTLAFWSTSLVMKLSTAIDQSCTKLYLKCPQAP